MGAIMSTTTLQTANVDFIMGEASVSDTLEIRNRVMKLKGKEITLPKSSNDYLEMVSNLKLPILLFSGIKDEFTTTKDSEKVINMSKNRTLVKFEGNHLEGFAKLSGKYYGEGYIEDINHFLVKEIK